MSQIIMLQAAAQQRVLLATSGYISERSDIVVPVRVTVANIQVTAKDCGVLRLHNSMY
jgi:hypothetical protein